MREPIITNDACISMLLKDKSAEPKEEWIPNPMDHQLILESMQNEYYVGCTYQEMKDHLYQYRKAWAGIGNGAMCKENK